MKKIGIITLILMVIILGACGVQGSTTNSNAELSNTIDTINGAFSVSVPAKWSKDTSIPDAEMIAEDTYLRVTDGQITFVDVYFYDTAIYDYPIDLVLEDSINYYGDKLVNGFQETQVDGMKAYAYEYSVVELGIDDNEYAYHGIEYLIDTPFGVAAVDVYYSQQVFESKIFKPTEKQLELLAHIGESFRVN